MGKKSNRLPGSFRDPSGFIFKINDVIYRQVNTTYEENYSLLKNSGLYKHLVNNNLIISHIEISEVPFPTNEAFKILQPEPVPFISYPYEWSFEQLKDAALLTLRIQQIALDYGMILKDASAYNIQFLRGKPILIVTL